MIAFRRFLDVVMISACLALSGCFTPALMRAAEGSARGGNINAAAVVGAFKSADGSAAVVCITMLDSSADPGDAMMLSIALTKSDRWQYRESRVGIGAIAAMRSGTGPQNVAGRYIDYRAGASDLKPGCLNHGQRLAVVEVSATELPGDSHPTDQHGIARLPTDANEAIVVVRRDGRLSNIGYVSSVPIAEDTHAIDVLLQRPTGDLQASDAKPYLLILAPVTVVMDAALVVLYAVAWAYSETGYTAASAPAPAPLATWKGSR